jgi:hypothetical protein
VTHTAPNTATVAATTFRSTNDTCAKAKVLQYALSKPASLRHTRKRTAPTRLTCAASTGNPIQADNTVWFIHHDAGLQSSTTGTNYGVNIGVHKVAARFTGRLRASAQRGQILPLRGRANKMYYVQVGDWYGDGVVAAR